VYDRLNALGDLARSRLSAVFDKLGVAAQVTGMGSLFNIHCCRGQITDYASARAGANDQSRALMVALLNEGFFLAPRGMGCITTPMTETDIENLASAVERILTTGGSSA
jgi:glutamate-1-semialdehyde 2,1-aminomutase